MGKSKKSKKPESSSGSESSSNSSDSSQEKELKNVKPKRLASAVRKRKQSPAVSSSSSSSSNSSSSSSSSSDSSSDSDAGKRKKSKKKPKQKREKLVRPDEMKPLKIKDEFSNGAGSKWDDSPERNDFREDRRRNYEQSKRDDRGGRDNNRRDGWHGDERFKQRDRNAFYKNYDNRRPPQQQRFDPRDERGGPARFHQERFNRNGRGGNYGGNNYYRENYRSSPDRRRGTDDERRPERRDNRDRSRSRDRGERRDDRRRSRSPRRNRNFSRRRDGDDDRTYEWGKISPKKEKEDSQPPKDKEKPNFGLSGKLAEDTNTVNGIVIKYSEPVEARKPKRRWRLYPFKGEKALPTMYIHRQSCFLVGRDRKVCDLPVDHPSCSKQHAALQYRLVPFQREDGTAGKRVRPYLIDLESANGTFLNNKKVESRKYIELIEKDVIKFGFSSREYVLLHENSKEDQEDDDILVEEDPVRVEVKEEPTG